MSELDKWCKENVGNRQMFAALEDVQSFFIRPNNASLQYAAAKLLVSAYGFSNKIALFNYPTEWVTNEKPRTRVHHWSRGKMFLIFNSSAKSLKFKTLNVSGVGVMWDQIRGVKEISTLSELFSHLKVMQSLSELPSTTESINDTEELLEKTTIEGDVYKVVLFKYLCSVSTKKAKPVSCSCPELQPAHFGLPYQVIRLEPSTHYQFGDTLTVRDSNNTNMYTDNKENQMKKGSKPRTGDRLVFTYTNGATYTVRGVISAEFNRPGMTINYQTKKTGMDGSVMEEKVSRPVTNEISTVVFEYATGCKRTLLDLRPKTEKAKEVQQPTRNKLTREEWEAMEAQKAQEAARQSRIAELQKELASLSN